MCMIMQSGCWKHFENYVVNQYIETMKNGKIWIWLKQISVI